MGKIKFKKEILNKYLEFFDYSPDQIVEEISTNKTKNKKKEEMKENLKKGEVEFQVLKKISEKFKINVYNFFLSDFNENNFLVDFKKKNRDIPFSVDTQYILRSYQNLREDIACLDEEYENRGKVVVSKNQSPENVAKEYRKKFGVDGFLKKGVSEDKVFKFLREKIEEEGVYVFKNNKGDKGSSKGLEENLYGCIFLDGDLPPLILINSDYPKISQIATLLHEFGHYLLGESEIEVWGNFEKNKTERWCNKFAYHFMITDEIEEKELFNKSNKENLKSNLNYLSDTYFISKMSLMIRFKELGIVNHDEYQKFLSKPYKKKKKSGTNDSGESGGNFHATKKERTSNKFLEVLSENFSSQKISQSEVSKYLGVKYDKVNKYLL